MAFTEGICEPIQQSLNAIAGMNAPALKRDRVGAVDALKSENNTVGFEAIQQSTNGKDRNVKITYYQRQVDTAILASCTNDCTGDEEAAPLETIFSVDNCLETPGQTFNEDEMAKLCEADSVWTAQIMASQFNAINVALDKLILAEYAANFGQFIDGSVLKSVKFFEDTTNAARTIAAGQILKEYDEAGGRGTPMFIGSGSLALFARQQQIACCNDLGSDQAGLNGEYLYYNDRFSTSVLANPEDFIVLEPGATQLVTWNRYMGDRAKMVPGVYEHGTITDPFTGLMYDLKSHYDDCADQWVIKLSLRWDLFILPSNVYAAGDDLNGVNGIYNFRDCSTIVACP